MSIEWVALCVFVVWQTLAMVLAITASWNSRPGVRGAALRYMVLGDRAAKECLTVRGQSLATWARRATWAGFVFATALMILR
jgi:hypothetical protein